MSCFRVVFWNSLSIIFFAGCHSIPNPYLKQSRDLTPVKMRIQKDLPSLELSNEGKTKVKLVIPASSPTSYYLDIAKLLKRYLDQATGADFKIVKEDIKTGNGIFIGPCADKVVQQEFNRLQKEPLETLLVRSFDRGIMLLGNDQAGDLGVYKAGISITHPKYSKGTLFAAIDFLERVVGYRFYFAGKLGTTLPDYRNKTLTIPHLSYQDAPAFSYRMSSNQYYASADSFYAQTQDKAVRTQWGTMMRLGDTRNQYHGHTDQGWTRLFAKDHPEYFALRKDGSRMLGRRGPGSAQRCYTSKEGLKAHINAIESFYKDGGMAAAFGPKSCWPDKHFIRWWPNDGFAGCHCKNCQKLIDNDAPRNRRLSRLIWYYITRLSSEVKKRWPDKKILVPIYGLYRTVPEGTKIPDNVVVIPVKPGTGFSIAYMKEPTYWDIAMKDLKKISKMNAEPAWMWMHYPHRPRISNGMYTPYPAPHVLSRYVRLCKDKLSGFYLNGHWTTVLAFDSVMLYLWHKLLWNPDINEDLVLEEYCKRMFGPASKTMLEYWLLITDRWENTRWNNLPDLANAMRSPDSLFSHKQYFGETYPTEVRNKLKALLQKAIGETKKGTIFHERMGWMTKASEKFFDEGAFFDNFTKREATAPEFTPTLDGKLDEWKKFPATLLLENHLGKPVTPKTSIWFSRDKKNLYLAGSVSEPTGKFNSMGKRKRDYPIWKGADIEVFICPDKPSLNGAEFSQASQFYQIVINEEGSIFDGYRQPAGVLDTSVDINFELKIKRHEKGFDFEMKIPFSAMNSNVPKTGDKWPINVYRVRNVKGAPSQAFSPTGQSFHNTERFGLLNFTKLELHSSSDRQIDNTN